MFQKESGETLSKIVREGHLKRPKEVIFKLVIFKSAEYYGGGLFSYLQLTFKQHGFRNTTPPSLPHSQKFTYNF